MAFDWSFSTQPYAVFDTRDYEASEPAFADSFDNFYEDQEIFQSFDSLSVESWAGLGCTCALSFITCDEHNKQQFFETPAISATFYTEGKGLQSSQHTSNRENHMSPSDSVTSPLNDVFSPPSLPVNRKQELTPQYTGRRTVISSSNKRILEDQFAADSYPSDTEIRLLSHRTDLSCKAIKTWFSNTRSRRLKLFRRCQTP